MLLTKKLFDYLDSVISGKRKGLFTVVLKLSLFDLSLLYSGVVRLRRWLYYNDILRAKRLPCKVISIGNIVAGGSGKTPAAIAIASMIRDYTEYYELSSLKMAIVTRGYRGMAHANSVVSDGSNILMNASDAGDEPYMMAHKLPGIPVIIGKDRYRSGLTAIQKWGSQVIILDDGFQYLRLIKDINIITIDSTRPFGFNYMLPMGYLREPLSTIKKADIILLTRVDQCKNLGVIKEKIELIAPRVPVFESVHTPYALYAPGTSQNSGLDTIKNRNILALCGISNPESFVCTLKSLNPARVDLISFPDHYRYNTKSIEFIEAKALEFRSDMIITTEKDVLKLSAMKLPVFVLAIRLQLIGSTDKDFMSLILQKIMKGKPT